MRDSHLLTPAVGEWHKSLRSNGNPAGTVGPGARAPSRVRSVMRAGPDGRTPDTAHHQGVDRLGDRQLPPVQRGPRKGLRGADAGHPHPEQSTRRDRSTTSRRCRTAPSTSDSPQAGLAYRPTTAGCANSRGRLRDIRGIAVLNSSAVHLLVGPASTIRSMDELRGRQVGIGPKGSGAAVTSQMVLRGYLPAGRRAGSRRHGAADHGDAARQHARRGFHDFERAERRGEEPDKGRRAAAADPRTGRRSAAHAVSVLPLRDHPGWRLPGQDQPVHTLSVDVVLLARAGLDDAIVRRLTEGLFRMLPQLSAQLPFLKGMVPERAPATPVPLHPGAALYYRERELRR